MTSVLLVDDVPLNRAVLRRVLQAAGAGAVVEAADGLHAHSLFTTCGGSQTFGLVLLDLRMPRCDGWTAASHMRAWERAAGWPPAKIVACTTEDISPGSPALQRCWDVGMDGAIGKALTRHTAAQLLEAFGPLRSAFASAPQGAPGAAPGECCELAGMGRSASAPLAQPSGMASPRSSLDSESGGLPDRLHSALCSGFYRRTSV